MHESIQEAPPQSEHSLKHKNISVKTSDIPMLPIITTGKHAKIKPYLTLFLSHCHVLVKCQHINLFLGSDKGIYSWREWYKYSRKAHKLYKFFLFVKEYPNFSSHNTIYQSSLCAPSVKCEFWASESYTTKHSCPQIVWNTTSQINLILKLGLSPHQFIHVKSQHYAETENQVRFLSFTTNLESHLFWNTNHTLCYKSIYHF